MLEKTKKWFNELGKIEKTKVIISLIGLVTVILVLINVAISENLKNNESAEYYKNNNLEYQNNSSNNLENKNENSVSDTNPDTKKDTEPFENASTFEDIKDEVKNQIKDEARKQGISLTEEQADKLTDYEIVRRATDNLENDPALRKEFDDALSNVKD